VVDPVDGAGLYAIDVRHEAGISREVAPQVIEPVAESLPARVVLLEVRKQQAIAPRRVSMIFALGRTRRISGT